MCMSIKFKQPFTWKTEKVIIDGEELIMVPVWKVFKQRKIFKQNIGSQTNLVLASPFRHFYKWEPNWNTSSRYAHDLTYMEKRHQEVTSGFHAFLRKKDAEEAANIVDGIAIKCYMLPADVVAKGWCLRVGSDFKLACVLNSFSSLASAMTYKDHHVVYAAIVGMKLYIPPKNFLKGLGSETEILNELGYKKSFPSGDVKFAKFTGEQKITSIQPKASLEEFDIKDYTHNFQSYIIKRDTTSSYLSLRLRFTD